MAAESGMEVVSADNTTFGEVIQETPVIVGANSSENKTPTTNASTVKSGGVKEVDNTGAKGKNVPGGKGPHKKHNRFSQMGQASHRDSIRFQVRLEKGCFTSALRDALMRDLNTCLFSSPPNSFIPSFSGTGLRFGVVWFAPDNNQSCDWLKEKLVAISEKAGDFKFKIEPFSLHQNRISISIPWDVKENLKDGDILRRLKFQNPRIPIDRWRIVKSQQSAGTNRFIFCCIDDDSLRILEKDQFKMSYAFEKIVVKLSQQNSSAKPSIGRSD